MATIPIVIGRFQIRSRIGQGGMGTLYLAWDPMLEREIAIKLLREDNDELRERFAREARSVARLRHPHIVMIFDVGEHEGQPFIAMEYIKGRTLAEIIRTTAPLTVVRKLQLVEELCDGLGFAHRAGIVHRDIKPANIIVDDEGSLKILDFGIARVGPGMTQAGMLIGTLNYMSPEQVVGSAVDGRSDIFAVGGVLYELLAYRQAFSGGLESGILNKILHLSPEPLETLCGRLDPEILQIVSRALEKTPAARYQDLPEMQKDLLRVRQRIEASQPTGHVPDVSASAPTIAIGSGRPTPTARTPRWEPDREALARRRAAQIEASLEGAEKALAARDYEGAIARCEEVLLLDTENPRASDLLDRAKAAIDERQADEWLTEAQRQIERGELTGALGLVQKALTLSPASSRGPSLLQVIQQKREEQERQRERVEACRRARARARALFDQGLFEAAAAAADEALAIDPGDSGALSVKQRATEVIEATRREALNQRAKQTIAEAQGTFQSGQEAAALKLLEAFDPPHPDVTRALVDLRAQLEARHREAERRREEKRRADVERQERERRVRAALDQAKTSLTQRDFAAALQILRPLQQSDPGAAGLQSLIAEAEAQQADAERARRIASEIRGHLDAASARLAAQDLDAAMTCVQSALALDPEHRDASALATRIQNAIRARERQEAVAAAIRNAANASTHEAALAALRRALELDPNHPEARRLFEARDAAWKKEQAEERRRQEIENACREIEADLASGALDAAARGIAALEEASDAKKAVKPLRRRLQQDRAAADKARNTEVGQLVRAARQALVSRDFPSARKQCARVLEIEPQSAEARALAREIEQAAAASQATASVAGAPQGPDAELAATILIPASAPESATILVARPHATSGASASATPSHSTSKDWRAHKARPVAVYIGAAVTLVVLLVVGYRALTDQAAPAPVSSGSPTLTATERPPLQTAERTEPEAPVPPPPASSPNPEAAPADQRGEVEQQVGPLRLLARQQFARGERQQALATALAGLKLRPQDDALQGVLTDLSREASASVQRARAAATAAGSALSAPYREALAKQQEGDRLVRSARPAESLRSHWDAADLFARAAEQGKIAGVSVPPSSPVPVQTVPLSSGPKPADTASPVNEPPVVTSLPPVPAPPSQTPVQVPVPAPPPQPPVQAPVPAPPPQPPVQARPPPPRLNEESAILSTLRAYEQAYSTLNLDAVKRVFPSVNATALGQAFAQMRAQRVQILNEQVSVTGTTATVTCQVRQRFEPRAGRASETTVNAIFRLQKSGSDWVIVERR